jgi:hypothetical protein
MATCGKLDDFIEKFESDQMLILAALILDWTSRVVILRGKPFSIKNKEALLALRNHRTIHSHPMFPGNQATLRDAYDSLLTFFQRLELSISTKLIDAESAKKYFFYWLERLIFFDRHPDKEGKILNGVLPEVMVRKYIEAYSNLESIDRLCDLFGVQNRS